MGRFVVVGLGNFGTTLAERLHQLGHDVVAIDSRQDVVDEIGPRVRRAVVGDGTNARILAEAGAEKADAAVVSTGDNLSASMLAVIALRDLGIKDIYVKVGSAGHARIADALGATETIFPERESALAFASRVTSGKLLQYVQLGNDLSLQEMAVPAAWVGKTLRELGLPQRHRVKVVAVHDVLRGTMAAVPDPDSKLTQSDTLLVAGEPQALQKLVALG